jgi:hypothetical protein
MKRAEKAQAALSGDSLYERTRGDLSSSVMIGEADVEDAATD